ncbi:MAG: hypothetical protein AAFR90_06090 [Pseudomonadota bacterium]
MDDCLPDGPDMLVRPELQSPNGRYVGEAFGIAHPSEKALAQCINALILSMLVALQLGYSGVRYSRNRNHYHGQDIDLPAYWSLKNVGAAANLIGLATENFIHLQRPPQIPLPGMPRMQSAIRPANFLLRHISWADTSGQMLAPLIFTG